MTPQAAGGKWRAHLVPVTTGLVNEKFVEIRSGLQEGEQVIYAGHEALKDGDPVVPTEWGPNGPLTLPPATGAVAPGTVYTCPMHPEVQSDKPGDCPRCGMKLQPKEPTKQPSSGAGTPSPAGSTPPAKSAAPGAAITDTSAGGKAVYYCQMHPEVTSSGPGKCPKCGMDLVPKPNGKLGATKAGTPDTGGMSNMRNMPGMGGR